MPNFMEQRRLARLIDQTSKQLGDLSVPEKGWVATVRRALGMSAEQVAVRKGVSRNAVYQAERSEKEGAVSLKQMDQLARAMGGRFVYAIVPDARVEELKYKQAVYKAKGLLRHEPEHLSWSNDDVQDWIEDKAAELLHDMPASFWDMDETAPRA